MKRKVKNKNSNGASAFIATVGALLRDMRALGYSPTLVGGMALVTLGSLRVTKDFDFLIETGARESKNFIDAFYYHGFELASKVDTSGHIVRTVNNAAVALAKLGIDPVDSAYFFHHELGLRVDLLFDFPISAKQVHERSHHRKIQSFSFYIANKEDLIQMKELAVQNRGLSTDMQDLEFLKKM